MSYASNACINHNETDFGYWLETEFLTGPETKVEITCKRAGRRSHQLIFVGIRLRQSPDDTLLQHAPSLQTPDNLQKKLFPEKSMLKPTLEIAHTPRLPPIPKFLTSEAVG